MTIFRAFSVSLILCVFARVTFADPAAPEPSRVRRPSANPVAAPTAIKLVRAEGESLDEAWDRYFVTLASRIEKAKDGEKALAASQRSLRQTAREQMEAKGYENTIAMLQAALRAGESSPWMYEALGLALQASKASEEDVERVLLSGVALSDDLEGAMFIALYMSKTKMERSALRLYRDISARDPQRPEPYVQGMACAKAAQDQDGIRWAAVGILAHSWPKEHRHIEQDALRQAQAIILALNRAGETEAASNFEKEANQAMARDCRVVVSWTGEADIDLVIDEPAGTRCSLEKKRSTSGGLLLGDSFSSGAEDKSKMQEVYECSQAFNGDYQVLVKKIWGKVTANTVTVDIYTKTRHLREQLTIDGKQAAFKFAIDDGRRKEPLAEQQIANVARVQNVIGRQVLAQQQLSGSATNPYLQNIARMRGIDPRLLLAGAGRGAVGFSIVPTVLQEGLSDSTRAVISADRRYVRVSPQPSIQAISSVSTFNVATGATNNVTDTVNGGGGGVGGVGS